MDNGTSLRAEISLKPSNVPYISNISLSRVAEATTILGS